MKPLAKTSDHLLRALDTVLADDHDDWRATTTANATALFSDKIGEQST